MFQNRQHKPESNLKRSETLIAMYATGAAPAGMGWPKYTTEQERRRARLSAQLKYRYGITMDDYDGMFDVQSGRCAICQIAGVKLVVDHSHDSGKVRGLLCTECNLGLGLLEKVGIGPVVDYYNDTLMATDSIVADLPESELETPLKDPSSNNSFSLAGNGTTLSELDSDKINAQRIRINSKDKLRSPNEPVEQSYYEKIKEGKL